MPSISQDADASLLQKIETIKNWRGRGSVRSVRELPAGGLRCISKYFYRAVLLCVGGGDVQRIPPKEQEEIHYSRNKTKENPAAILLSAPLRFSARHKRSAVDQIDVFFFDLL
jgi:hypothetical protein